jgi:hypothetical protein
MNTREEQFQTIQDEGFNLFKRKNQDYGDAFATYGTVGVLVRMGDKIMRYQNITNKGITLVDDEQLRDTLIDLHNYSAMAVMLLDEKEQQNKEIVDNTAMPQVISWGIYGKSGETHKRTQTRIGGQIIKDEFN